MKVKVKKPIYKKWWFWVIAVLIIAGALGSNDEEEKVKEEKPKVEEASAEVKSAKPEKTEAENEKKAEEEAAAAKKAEEEKAKAEEEAKIQTPEYKLNAAVKKAIGKDKEKLVELTYDESQNIYVKFKGDDNLTANMIVTGIQGDIKGILENVKKSEVPFNDINVVATFPMVDQYGNESEDDVVDLLYTKATVDKINFDNFLTDNVYSVADIKAYIHPEFAGKE